MGEEELQGQGTEDVKVQRACYKGWSTLEQGLPSGGRWSQTASGRNFQGLVLVAGDVGLSMQQQWEPLQIFSQKPLRVEQVQSCL